MQIPEHEQEEKKRKKQKKKKKHKDLYRSRMSAEFSFFFKQEVIMAFEMTKMTSILCMY